MKQFVRLLATGKTVWNINDVHLFLWWTNKQYTRLILHRMKKAWLLITPAPWIYCLPHYDRREFASKLRPWSYISCETVLVKDGILFQSYDNTVTLVSNNSVEKIIENKTYRYHKVHARIMSNPIGIINHENKYLIASPERALCDLIYLTKTMTVDNPKPLKTQLMLALAEIYNHSTQKRIYSFLAHAWLQ